MKTLLRLLALPLLLLAACNEELVCADGETACGGRCVSLLSDAAHCGACGNACGDAEVCSAGACGCGVGATTCGDACAVLASDPGHCGACETSCDGSLVCSEASCAPSCANGLTSCDRACVDLARDRFHCGACGNSCEAGESCTDGACRADLQIACFATNDVRPVTFELEPSGPPRSTAMGPIALALQSGFVYVASSLAHSVTALPLNARLTGEDRILEGADFENLVSHEELLFISNSGRGTLLVYDPARDVVLDEVVLGSTSDVNPRGVAFVKERAFVALNGLSDESGGHSIAILDLAGLRACASSTTTPRPDCATLEQTIDLRATIGAFDAPGLPFPVGAVAHQDRVYVTLSNLRKPASGDFKDFYIEPAGPGRLAVIDTTAGDALSIVSLGACRNPGAVKAEGDALWIACGDASAPGLLRVDVSGAVPAPASELVALPLGAPGNLAFCNGMGYVTDLWSGQVIRFDPQGAAEPLAVDVCPTMGFAWASDVACAQ
jgi:hypothetical protein